MTTIRTTRWTQYVRDLYLAEIERLFELNQNEEITTTPLLNEAMLVLDEEDRLELLGPSELKRRLTQDEIEHIKDLARTYLIRWSVHQVHPPQDPRIELVPVATRQLKSSRDLLCHAINLATSRLGASNDIDDINSLIIDLHRLYIESDPELEDHCWAILYSFNDEVEYTDTVFDKVVKLLNAHYVGLQGIIKHFTLRFRKLGLSTAPIEKHTEVASIQENIEKVTRLLEKVNHRLERDILNQDPVKLFELEEECEEAIEAIKSSRSLLEELLTAVSQAIDDEGEKQIDTLLRTLLVYVDLYQSDYPALNEHYDKVIDLFQSRCKKDDSAYALGVLLNTPSGGLFELFNPPKDALVILIKAHCDVLLELIYTHNTKYNPKEHPTHPLQHQLDITLNTKENVKNFIELDLLPDPSENAMNPYLNQQPQPMTNENDDTVFNNVLEQRRDEYEKATAIANRLQNALDAYQARFGLNPNTRPVPPLYPDNNPSYNTGYHPGGAYPHPQPKPGPLIPPQLYSQQMRNEIDMVANLYQLKPQPTDSVSAIRVWSAMALSAMQVLKAELENNPMR